MKTLLSACLILSVGLIHSLHGSTSADQGGGKEPERSGNVQLPMWDDYEAMESFDIRIWPEEVIHWLEMENLRDLIADPTTPVAERNELKRILAMQRAWRTS